MRTKTRTLIIIHNISRGDQNRLRMHKRKETVSDEIKPRNKIDKDAKAQK